LLLSFYGFQLFSDRLLGVGITWRSEHYTETGSQVLGAWSPSLDGGLDLLIEVERIGLVCARGTDEACVPRYPTGIH
jgi:hypothetical protein